MAPKDNGAKPKWWLLYMTFPITMGLFYFAGSLALSQTDHGIVEVGILLFESILVEIWIRSNSSALRREDLQRAESLFTVTEILPQASPQARRSSAPHLVVAPEEIHGVLDTTIQMDFGDRKPVQASQPAGIEARESS